MVLICKQKYIFRNLKMHKHIVFIFADQRRRKKANPVHTVRSWKDGAEEAIPPPPFCSERKAFLSDGEASPLSIFELALGKNFFKDVAQETNRYADQS